MSGAPAPARTYITTEEAGHRLRRVREKLGLKFRDVEEASQILADHYENEEFVIGLSRLSEIENRGLTPSVFRLYSLSTIYRLDIQDLLRWYGVFLAEQAADSQLVPLPNTHPVCIPAKQSKSVPAPLSLDPGADLTQTTFLSRLINKWGPLPLDLFRDAALAKQRYALLGTEDWSMYPILRPGSLLLIDETKKIATGGWSTEWERPIYFLEHREGFQAGWCSMDRDRLIVLPHHSSRESPRVYLYPNEVDILGEVKGVAMILSTPGMR